MSMTTIELSTGCKRWTPGDPTMHPPHDRALLEAVAKEGFVAFKGPSGLCGGKTEDRTVLAIHRGRGVRWEIVFRENDTDVVTTVATNLERMTTTILVWLRGGSLTVDEDSLHAVAG
jgi:hypothetical protein